MSIVGEMTTVARRKIGKTYLGLWFAIFMMVALVAIMWMCNITGSPGWALFIGSFGMIALTFITFAPKTVFIFLGFGALVAELKDEDISQGTLKGVNALYRVFLALGYAFMGMSGLLGTWSFANYPAAFWVIAFFGTFLLILLAHNKVTMGKWMLYLAGGYAIAVILWMIGMTMHPVQKASNTLNDTIVAGASSLGIKSKSPAELAAERAMEAEAEKQRVINAAVAQAAAEAEAAKYRPLTKDAFTTKTIGKFEPLYIKSGQRVGPITRYDGTCLYWTKTGMGMIEIYSRPDFVSNPKIATLTDREYGIKKWGHEGVAFQMFFEAKQGDIQIELERREGNSSC
jgi:hypothetical protein